jgi:hypothetical protein
MKFGLLYEIEVLAPWDEDTHLNVFVEPTNVILSGKPAEKRAQAKNLGGRESPLPRRAP